jgi:acetyl-CoA synthetase
MSAGEAARMPTPPGALRAEDAYPTIVKVQRELRLCPNLADYDCTCHHFTWDSARLMLEGLPHGRGLNIAHEAVDRHASGPLAGHLALRWIGKDRTVRDFSYDALRKETNRFANILRSLGVAKGDRVFALMGRTPELYVTALGTLKNLGVFCQLFSAFGPEPVQARLGIGDGRMLVTTESLYRRKVAGIRDQLTSLDHLILVGEEGKPANVPGALDWNALMADADEDFEIPPTDPEDMALLHFTSGTTGRPKGAIHVHEAVVAHHVTGKFVLDLHPQDVFWCTADPGWVTGTSYGIIAPLTCGITNVVVEAEFDAELWYRILEQQKVTVWYTAPTAIRMLMKLGAETVHKYDLSALRFMASVGEPLNPEAVVWSKEAFGMPFHDNWWQTETGGIMIANYAAMDVKPGSMGKPLPGIEAEIVRRTGQGEIQIVEDPHTQGELALRPGWPSMFRGYLGDEERYRKCFAGGWYLTGTSGSSAAPTT